MKASGPATVAEAIRRHGQAYLDIGPVPPGARRLMALLPLCRTAGLGGHLHRCTECGHEQPRYNSCGNRHCPNCQAYAREKWLTKQEESLLDLPYFHMVFTLPAELQPLLLQNKRVGYNLLFKSVADTLLKFGRDPRHGLEGQLGFTAVLHTWDQRLRPHAHLHVLIPAGALSRDGTVFRVAPDRKWIFPVRALSKVFRALFVKRLRKQWQDGSLEFHGRIADLSQPDGFHVFLDRLFETDWVVYAKRPFGGPEAVLRYLGRYTHRVGISNARLQTVDDHGVRFTARDPKDASKKQTVTLRGPEFLRRFFSHILPDGFTRIRHYGFLGNSVRHTKVPRIRKLIGQPAPEVETTDPCERLARHFGARADQCPCCKTGRLLPVHPLPAQRCNSPPAP